MNIGIDLGSTYSGFARYDKNSMLVEPIALKEGEPFSIPSVVYVDSKGKVYTGYGAKNKKVRTGRFFEYFKMLLNEKDESVIASRGYDDNYTPRKITKMYLENNLKASLKAYNDSKIEKLCICVPEIWNDELNTLDGRSILIDILTKEIDIPIGHVQVVTEPEAASAFFAFNYEKETERVEAKHKTFNGYLLLIDYGGGTLDISLTEVKSSGQGSMEICCREGCGAGENHIDSEGNRIVGNAGVSYILGVVYSAIKESEEFCDSAIDFLDPDFIEATREFESTLKSSESMDLIENYFTQFGSYSDFGEALNQKAEDFGEFTYKDEVISVSFQCLFRAYKQNIETVLAAQVREINKRIQENLKKNPCSPSSGNNDDFKIALVGGFGGCFFVKAQLYEIYNMDANAKNDPRVKHISTNKMELAISLGAALIAADRVRLQKTAKYSIGLYASDASGRFKPYYGIKYHQIVVPNKPYFMLRDDSKRDEPGNRVVYANLTGIKQFMIEFSGNLDSGRPMSLTPVMLDKLKDLPEMHFWNCGFSVDDSDVVSFHILPSGSEDISNGKTIRLDNYSKMFNLSAW